MNKWKYYGMAFLLVVTMTGCGKKDKVPKLKNPASESVQSVKAVQQYIAEEELTMGCVTGRFSACYYTDAKENISYKVALGEKVTKGQTVAVADTSEYDAQIKDLQEQLAAEKEDISYQKKHVALEIDQLKEQKRQAAEQKKTEENTEVDKTDDTGTEKDTEDNSEEDAISDAKVIESQIKRLQTDLEYQEQLSKVHIHRIDQEIAQTKKQIEENTLKAAADGQVAYISYGQNANAMENVVMISNDQDNYVALVYELSDNAQKTFIRAYTTYQGKEQELKEIPYTEKEEQQAVKNNMILPPRFELADDSMQPGDYIDVHVVLQEADQAITVPWSCVYTGEDSQYIYKIVNDRKEKCMVETGISDGVDVQIVSGLEAGEEVFYPVDEKQEYSETETVQKGSLSLWNKTGSMKKEYPRSIDLSTGVEEAQLVSITEQSEVEQGATVATVSLTTGQADVKDTSNQIESLKRQYQQQKKTGEDTIKQLKKQLKQEGKKSSVELSMAQLELDYNAKVYTRQLKGLETLLAGQSKVTGNVAVKAPCSGSFTPMYGADREHVIMDADGYVGTINDTSIAYYAVDNSDNKFHYGDKVQVKAGDTTYDGKIIGAYPSGSQDVTYTGAEGQVIYYSSDPEDKMTMAYVALDQGADEVESGSVNVVSNVISDAIVISQDDIRRGEEQHDYVWILKEGKPYKQYVQYLKNTNNDCWVLKGLSEGDVILKGAK